MKGGGLCEDKKFEFEDFEQQDKKRDFIPYTWGSDSMIGNFTFATSDCGFFIDLTNKPDGTNTNDYFVSVEKKEEGEGDKKTSKVVIKDIVKQTGTASPNVFEINVTNIDKTLTPIAALDHFLHKNRKTYHVLEYEPETKTLKSLRRSPKTIEEVKQDESAVQQIEEASTEKVFTIKQHLKEEDIGGVTVLKLVGVSNVDEEIDEKGGKVPPETLNKENISKVLCNKISEKLSKDKTIGNIFNLSNSQAEAARVDAQLDASRNQLALERMEKAQEALYREILKLDDVDDTGNPIGHKARLDIENKKVEVKALATSIDNYIFLKDFLGSEDASKNFVGDKMKEQDFKTNDPIKQKIVNAILEKHGTNGYLNTNQMYNFYIACTNRLSGLNKELNTISEIKVTDDQNHKIVFNENEKVRTLSSLGRSVHKPDEEYFSFMKRISKFLFSIDNIPVGDKNLRSKTIGQQVTSARNFVRRGFQSRKTQKASPQQAAAPVDPNAATAPAPVSGTTTTGGKRKTRKNKVTKTRRKVQRKRRQSKKH